jgi:hypothetical protein
MAGQIKLPGIGPVDKKWVYVGGALIAGIAGYAYFTRSATSEEPEVSDYTTEPDYAMDGGEDEYVNPGGSEDPVEEDYVSAPTNNAEWSQKAISYLTDHGYNALAAPIAVGRYMARKSLNSNQANMVRVATAALGPPPSGSFPIKVTPGGSDPKPPTTKPVMKAPSGLRVTDRYRDKVRLAWNPVSLATGYAVYKVGQSSATEHALSNAAYAGSLKPNTTYKFYVKAMGPDKHLGPASATVTVKTKR